MSQTDDVFAACDAHECDEAGYLLFAYAPQSGLRSRTITMSLEAIEDDNGLCYCIPVPGALPNPDLPQLCLLLAEQRRHLCRSSRTSCPPSLLRFGATLV